jgi:hypothetical protein
MSAQRIQADASGVSISDNDKVPKISDAERAKRQEAIDYARASVRLEGFILSAECEALAARYINGDITRKELTAAILAMHGVEREC